MKRFLTKTFFLLLGFFLCASTLNAQVPGNCLAFDGIDDYVPCGQQNSSIFTVEAWANPSIVNADQAIVSTLNDLSNWGMEIHINSSAFPLVTVRNNSGTWLDVVSSAPVIAGTWNHFAASYDGVTVKLYVNGIIMASSPLASYNVGTSPFTIGCRARPVLYFKGKIDEVRYWNVARTQAQIQQNIQNELNGTEAGLLSYYKFNQTTTANLTDTKGSYNGTFYSFAFSGSVSNWTTAYSIGASNVTPSGFTATWQPIAMATRYRIDVSDKSDFSNLLASNVDAGAGTSFNVTGLSLNPNTPYYYRMRYESAFDTSSNSLPAVILLSPGNALSFDGVNDYVSTNDWKLGSSDFCIEFWTKPTSNTGWRSMVSNRTVTDGDGQGGKWYSIQISDAGVLHLEIGNDGQGNYNSIFTTFKPPVNTWSHIAVTRFGKNLKVYANGIVVYDATLATINDFNSIYNTVEIGSRHWGGSPNSAFQGQLDELKVWKVARSQSDIQGDMYTEAAGNEAGLFAYYNFNQNLGKILLDLTANGNTGSFGDYPQWLASEAICPIANAATNISISGFTANWNAVSGATTYKIDVSDKSDFSNLLKNNVDCGNVTSYNFADLSLVVGTTYYYRVRAVVNGNVISNSAAISVMLAPGNAIALDGTNDYITVPQISTGWNDLTIETWINLSQPQNSNGYGIYNTDSWSPGTPHFQIFATGVEFAIFNNTGVTAPYIFTPNTWYHVAVTYSNTGKSAKIYINGTLIKSVIQGATIDVWANLTSAKIGSYNGSRMFNGKMDEYRIWNKELSQAELQARMYKELIGNEANLCFYYNFNKGEGGANNAELTTINDLATVNSASPKNGTLTNSTLNGNTSNYIVSGACAPLLFEATNISTTGFTANWTAATGATKYRIDISDKSDFSKLLTNGSNVDAGAGTSFALTGLTLTKGATYYYRMHFESASGVSNYSNVKQFMLQAGNAFAFDGSDDYIIIPRPVQDDFTMECWFNTTQSYGSTGYWYDGAGMIDGDGGSPNNDFGLSMLGGKVCFGTGNPDNRIISSLTYNDGNWHHVAVTRTKSSGQLVLYVDGTQVASGTGNVGSSLTTPTNLLIGTNAHRFNGKLDEIRFWNTVRSAAEIKSAMYSSLSGNEVGLAAYYNLNQGIASGANTGLTTISDLTGNGNNGNLINSALVGTASNYVSSQAMNYIQDASNVTSTGFTANWLPVAAATKYRIDVSSMSDFNTLLVSDVDAGTGTSFAVTGLTFTAGTNYYYRMRFESAAGTSANSETKLVKPASGNALTFDCDATAGTYNDYISLGTVSPSGNFSTGFTYMGWVKWNAFQSWSRLFDFGTGAGGNNILLANNSTSGTLTLDDYSGGTSHQITTSKALPLNQWVHIAVTINSSGVGAIYMNGQIIGIGNIGLPVNTPRTLCYLGRSNWSDAYFKGSMDEVSFWTRALSADEIHGYMNASLTGGETGLYLYYNFNQGVPAGTNTGITSVTDVMGHNNGTLNNYALTGTAGNFVNSEVSYAPFLYEASNVTPTGFTANWKTVSGATKYRVDVSDKNDFSNLLASNVDAGTGTSFTVTGLNLSLGANYYCRMRYENANGTSGNSVTKAFMVGTGNSLSFNGGSSNVNIFQIATGLNEVTFESWVYRDAMDGNWRSIYNTNLWTTGSTHFQFYVDNRLGLWVGNNTPTDVIYFNQTFNAGTWYHVAASYNATAKQVSLYVNGNLVNTGTYTTANAINLTDAQLGQWYDQFSSGSVGRYYNGKLDNFRIWSKARSQAEIKANMNSDVVGNEANLLLSYNFNIGVPNGNNTAMLDASSIANLPDATGTCIGQLRGFALTGTSSNYVNNSPSNNIFYVNASAAAGGNGLTPATAFNNLQLAFAAATGVDTIKVAAGNYYQPAYNVSLVNNSKSLTLLGGYNSGFTSRDVTNNVTAISGVSGAINPIINILDCNFTIDGFTLQNGVGSISTAEGGAIHYYAQTNIYNLNINNCIFLNNKTTPGNGGALWMSAANSASKANISNCIFRGNNVTGTSGWGGAIADAWFTASITNCVFDNNRASNGGGGAIMKWGALTLTNNTFTNQLSPGNGSAIELNNSTSTMRNNTFFGNNCTVGTGTIHLTNSSGLFFYHNTMVGNTSGNCGGLSNYAGCTVQMAGNIIVGNTGGQTSFQDIWNQSDGSSTGAIIDQGYNIFSAAGNFTMASTSQWVNSDQLYNILESTNQSNTLARLFPAKVANNGGLTPTIKVIGRVLKNSGSSFKGIRVVPNTFGITTDQKGANRLSGYATIGAYESDIPLTENVIYVNSNLTSLGDGRTPANAYNNLQAAFACTASDTIKVAAGTYTQPSTSNAFGNYGVKNIIVYGAYKSDFTVRDTVLYRTALQANANSVVPILWFIDGSLTIDGFTLKNGIASSGYEGGAIHFDAQNAAYNLNVSNCIFENNKTTGGRAGAVWLSSAYSATTTLFTNCTFNGNSSGSYGGAILSSGLTNIISSCTFINNKALSGVGGAIAHSGDSLQVKNSTFFNNTTNTNAGAIWSGSNAVTTLTQNTIVGNFNSSTGGAGAVDCATGKMSLQGNIIAGNYSNVGLAYDVWQESGSVTDNGFNIFGTNGANNFTPTATSIVINNDQLYKILESSNQTNTSLRLFPAKIANNGGATPTIKIIGKFFNSTTVNNLNVRQVPAKVASIDMPATDQRNNVRTIDAACIGAYEMNSDEKYIYVNISAPASGSDGTLAHPYNDITVAISKATINDTIKVATGIYSAPATSFIIDKNVVLMGGFNAAFTQYDPKSFISSIQFYTGSTPLVKINNTSAELNGFTIQNSQSTVLGGGVLVNITDNKAYNIVIKNCIFNTNHASNGGGISLDAPLASSVYSNVLITNCTFKANVVTAYGGAISASGRFNTTVINSTFFGNAATINGGAIYQGQDGTLKLQQNTIVGNKCTTTTAGGGVTCTSTGTADLRANIIAGNFSGSAKHDVYKESGSITDNGYNIYGNLGTVGFTKDVSSDSVKTPELYVLLKSDTITPTGHAGTYMADRQFYAGVVSNGGYSPTIKLLKKTFANSASITKNITIVPAIVNGTTMAVLDQREVNRIIGTSCVGSFEYRDTLPTMHIVNDELTSNAMHMHFTPGSFSKRMVFVKNGSATSELPANNTNFVGDNEFGKGSQIGTSGWYCVYNGNDTSVSVTGIRPVQPYSIKIFEYNDIANYYTDLSKATGKNNPKSIITPKMIQTIGFSIGAKNWGDADVILPDTTSLGLSNIIYTSSNPLVASVLGSTVHIVGVGTTLIKANHAGNDSILAAPEVNRSFVVNADTLFITAINTNSTFGETPVFNFVATGLKNNDSIIAQAGVTYSSIAKDTSNVGDYDVTPSSAVFANGRGVASNYIFKYSTGTHTINKASLSIKADDKSKVFGKANPAFSFTATGLKHSDEVAVITYSTAAVDTSFVGNYAIEPSTAVFVNGKASNYNMQLENGTLAVTTAEVIVKAIDTSKVYGTANPKFRYSVSGLKFADAIDNVIVNSLATDSCNAGIYALTASNAVFAKGKAENYTVIYSDGKLTVNPAALTIVAESKSKLYGSVNPEFTYIASGLKYADAVKSVSITTLADVGSKVGSYNILPSNAILQTSIADNYVVNYISGTLTVMQAPLTIKADDKSRVYFSPKNPELTYTYTGFVNNENESALVTKPIISCVASKASIAGTYPISLSGAQAENYVISYVVGNLIVAESPVQICLVSIDLTTSKNMVIWERKKGFGIKNYKVYRETTTANDYAEIGTLPFAKEGVYVDLTSQPENQQHRYKISAVDSLGNESVLSNYHEPMFLQYNNAVNGINLSWKPYAIEGGSLEFKSYILYRGADSTKLDSFKTLSANATVYIDTDPTSLKGLMFYRLGGILKSACNSQSLLKAGGGPFVESVSNLEDNRLRSSGIRTNGLNMELTLYPQPASSVLNVRTMLEKAGNVEFEICNLMGAYISKVNAGYMNSGMASYTIDLTNFNLPSGVYYLKLKTNSTVGVKSFIIKN